MTIPESLKRFRIAYKLRQKDVADTLGISQQAYQAYEKNSYPSSKLIVQLANAYDVSADYLLGRTDEPRPPKFDEETLNLIRAMEAFKGRVPTA